MFDQLFRWNWIDSDKFAWFNKIWTLKRKIQYHKIQNFNVKTTWNFKVIFLQLPVVKKFNLFFHSTPKVPYFRIKKPHLTKLRSNTSKNVISEKRPKNDEKSIFSKSNDRIKKIFFARHPPHYKEQLCRTSLFMKHRFNTSSNLASDDGWWRIQTNR